MRYPQHLLLDYSPTSNVKTTMNWIGSYTKQIEHNSPIINRNSCKNQFKNLTNSSTPVLTDATVLFDINFLRKDKIYTKLKYSRCPQYDIVSGGWAALFAGLVGFLISEKFGIELVDSGDFYTVFMYGVFACFSLRPLLRIADKNTTWIRLLTLHNLFTFFTQLLVLISRFFKNSLKNFLK